MNTYEVKIAYNGQVYTEIWSNDSMEGLLLTAQVFYGASATIKSARKMRLSAVA